MRFRRLAAPFLALSLTTALLPTAAVAREAGAELPDRADDTAHVGTTIEDRLLQELPAAQAAELKQQVAVAEEANDRAARQDTRGVEADEGPGTTATVADPTADELVGTVKTWVALDDVGQPETFGYYEKEYRLAAVGEHIELWVAVGDGAAYDEATGTYSLPFPEGDCRNAPYDGARVEITPEQLSHLVTEFDTNIHPKETEVFSTPPARNGDEALWNLYQQRVFPSFEPRPEGYFATPGGADRTVTLIDNVRDDNYYEGDTEQLSYIAGFFSTVFNAMFDRNVMTIDAWDWLHRTGDTPPNDPTDDVCTSASARPNLYEGTFAHEWQHLLQSYVGGESIWLNEGLSDWAQTLTGYADPSRPITDQEFDSHIQCFYGYLAEQTDANPNPRENAGPENSLTWWSDQGSDEILCDYGAAYTMLEYLVGQYGVEAATFLHNDKAAGLDSVGALGETDGRTALDILHDWAAMSAVDAAIDEGRSWIRGGDADRLTTPTLSASVNWDVDDAYDTPGAPPNGSDYVRLRGPDGEYLRADDLGVVTFDGATTYAPDPTEWVVTGVAPGREGDDVLWSTEANGLDSAVVYEVEVPAHDPTLSFATAYDFEVAYDFGVVQVSTDGGDTYTSLANDLTTTENAAAPHIAEQLPGLNGASDGWITTSFDLSAYAGETIQLSFRVLTDGVVTSPGWWIDDVTVGGTPVTDGSELGRSPSEVRPQDVVGWKVQLVSIDEDGGRRTELTELPLDEHFTGYLKGFELRRRLVVDNGIVAAIVTHDEPTEAIRQYAPYTLTVNGVVQPGGR